MRAAPVSHPPGYRRDRVQRCHNIGQANDSGQVNDSRQQCQHGSPSIEHDSRECGLFALDCLPGNYRVAAEALQNRLLHRWRQLLSGRVGCVSGPRPAPVRCRSLGMTGLGENRRSGNRAHAPDGKARNGRVHCKRKSSLMPMILTLLPGRSIIGWLPMTGSVRMDILSRDCYAHRRSLCSVHGDLLRIAA